MNLWEGVRIALGSLWTHKLRTLLTLLGNIVGTMQNGDTIDFTLGINSGTVALVVPEPTTASLALFMGLFYFVRQRSSETRR